MSTPLAPARWPRLRTQVADGSQQVQLTLAAAAIEVAGSPYYTEIARGPQFFDADRYPHIHFLSEPHLPALVHDGGRLRGKLGREVIETRRGQGYRFSGVSG